MSINFILYKKMTQINVNKVGTQLCYSWIDEHGYHQYYCERIVENVGKIVDFQKKTSSSDSSIIYSWRDNCGYHQYHLVS